MFLLISDRKWLGLFDFSGSEKLGMLPNKRFQDLFFCLCDSFIRSQKEHGSSQFVSLGFRNQTQIKCSESALQMSHRGLKLDN